MRCNGGTSATLNATAAPGDKVTAVWNQWTHSQGPITVYLFKCAGAFSACDGSGAGWFKIDEAGFKGDGVKVFLDTEKGSGWEIAKLVGGGKSWTSTLPPGLAAGSYLLRHELLALHQANAPQFYPQCAQLVVTGSGTALPDASYKTAIPGYAKQTDANIKVSHYRETTRERGDESAVEKLTAIPGCHQQPRSPADLRYPRPAGVEGRGVGQAGFGLQGIMGRICKIGRKQRPHKMGFNSGCA